MVTKKTKKKTTKRKAGPAPFAPTPEMRQNVEALSAGGVPANVIREIIINPKTGRAISRTSLLKHFRIELNYGSKKITGKAITTIVSAMDGIDKYGSVNSAAVSASKFWLATRENELFSERRINESVTKTSEIAEINETEALRIADNVTKSAGQNAKARKRRKVVK